MALLLIGLAGCLLTPWSLTYLHMGVLSSGSQLLTFENNNNYCSLLDNCHECWIDKGCMWCENNNLSLRTWFDNWNLLKSNRHDTSYRCVDKSKCSNKEGYNCTNKNHWMSYVLVSFSGIFFIGLLQIFLYLTTVTIIRQRMKLKKRFKKI